MNIRCIFIVRVAYVCVKWPTTQGDKNIKYHIVTLLSYRLSSYIFLHFTIPDQSVININNRIYIYIYIYIYI